MWISRKSSTADRRPDPVSMADLRSVCRRSQSHWSAACRRARICFQYSHPRIDTYMNKVGECIYCGETRQLTSDHVPPRCLFSKPRPPLVTVPCCLDCNREFGKYDEYFRLAITTGINREAFPNES